MCSTANRQLIPIKGDGAAVTDSIASWGSGIPGRQRSDVEQGENRYLCRLLLRPPTNFAGYSLSASESHSSLFLIKTYVCVQITNASLCNYSIPLIRRQEAPSWLPLEMYSPPSKKKEKGVE